MAGLEWISTRTIYKLENISSRINAITETEGFVVLFDEYPNRRRDAIFIFNDTSRQKFALAYGRVFTPRFSRWVSRFWMNSPIQVTPATLIDNDSLFLKVTRTRSSPRMSVTTVMPLLYF